MDQSIHIYIYKKATVYPGSTDTLHLRGTEEPGSCRTSMSEDQQSGCLWRGLCGPMILQNFTDHSNPVKTGGCCRRLNVLHGVSGLSYVFHMCSE